MTDTFGKRPIPTRSGGSIPIVAGFEKILGLKSILMGFGLATDDIHAPNENYPLQQFFKGIETKLDGRGNYTLGIDEQIIFPEINYDPNYKNPVLKKSNINEVIKKMKRKPKIEPKSTKSLDLLMEVRRKEIEERERKVEEKMLEDLLRKERQDRLKERVQNSKAIIDNKKQLEENRRKLQEDFMNNLQKNKEYYQNELQRRLEKVYAAPLMLEQIGSGKGEKFTMNKNTKDDLNELLADQEDNDVMDENENQDENIQVEADDEYDEANEEKENEE